MNKTVGMIKPFMTNKDVIEYSPMGKNHFWEVIKKDKRFPKPLPGMGQHKDIYSGEEIEAYFMMISKTGIPETVLQCQVA